MFKKNPHKLRSLRGRRERRAGPDIQPPEEAEPAGVACHPPGTVGGLPKGRANLSSFAQGKVAGTPVLMAAAWSVMASEMTQRQLSHGRGKD